VGQVATLERLSRLNQDLAAELQGAQEQLHRYRELFRLAPAGYLVTDADGTILEGNHASKTLLRTDEAGLLGRPVTSFLGDGGSVPVRSQLSLLHSGEQIRGWEVSVRRSNGVSFPAIVDVAGVRDALGRMVELHWQVSDISDRKRAEEHAAFVARHDDLTGLPNRAMFEELLALALSRAQRRSLSVAVLYMDLDNFKLVNDTFGHTAGDDLLRKVATRLSGIGRGTDVVARLAGDEFAILLSDLTSIGGGDGRDDPDFGSLAAEWVAGRIQESLLPPFRLRNSDLLVTSSIGISVFPVDAQDEQSLFEHADAAMYRSKKLGPGGYMRFSGGPSNRRTTSFAARLHRAVQERSWVLHYQPIIDLEQGDVVGAEALLRWRDRDDTLVPPGQFIHLAEEMGLIEDIGEWVLDEVTRQAQAWQAEGFGLDVGFNLSAHQLWDSAFARRVLSTLESAGIDPSSIVIEITESVAMAEPDRRLEILWDLHAQGVRLAIDDFGTGYSSLTRLKHLPADILKIDRSFVRDLPVRPGETSLAAATIQLANNLGLTPLAEGIETDEQRLYLVEHGCTLGQGFWLSPPLPAEEITSLIKARTPSLEARRS
jgi:PAS domain S-box-containing protein